MSQLVEQTEAAAPRQTDFLPIEGTDHIEFYVGNAKQAAYFYRAAMGFRLVAYSGPETGTRGRASYVLEQNKIRFVLTTPLDPTGDIADHVAKHGDSVKSIALLVNDAKTAWAQTTERSGVSVHLPSIMRDQYGSACVSAIKLYGDAVHTFVERHAYHGAFLPGFVAVSGPDTIARETGLLHIDHIVGNVGRGQMNNWVRFYEQVMGFRMFKHFDDQDISTEYSALMSKVMTNGNERIRFPLNEPAEGKRKSQIQEYLEFHGGPGVQHIAMATRDIVETVTQLRQQGVEFLQIPTTYYDELTSRVGKIDEPIDELAKLGILVDRDDEGYMLQIFTKPVEDRPTLFFEIIQRKGSRSFGKGNFKALFEAIEREQARRGNL
jgi:4-hydroxyphenylpyruvate dioxygenase